MKLSLLSTSRTLALLAATALATSASAATLLDDDFDGASLSLDNWSSKAVSDNGSFTTDSSIVTIGAGPSGGTPRGTILSTGTNFNPFSDPLTITLQGLTASGPSGTPYAFAMIGRHSSDTGAAIANGSTDIYNYFPGTSGGSLNALAISLDYSTAALTYYLRTYDIGSGGTTSSSQLQLSAAPTSIAWTIQGDGSYTVTLTGATFTGGALAGQSVLNGTYARFTEAGLITGGEAVSRLAIGAVSPNAVATLDSVTAVSAIPEPSTYALFASAFICGFVVLRRRARKN